MEKRVRGRGSEREVAAHHSQSDGQSVEANLALNGECRILPLLSEGENLEGSGDATEIESSMNVLDINAESMQPLDLESFREQWKRELNITSDSSRNSAKKTDEEMKEIKAGELFLEGVEHERRGDMSEAVKKYTKAVKLVPDIERRVSAPVAKQDSRTRSLSRDRNSAKMTNQGGASGAAVPIEEEGELTESLSVLFQRKIDERGTVLEANDDGQPCPFQRLPLEIVLLLIRYVVGSKVDLRNMLALSKVAPIFYLLLQDEELWRSILVRTVGEDLAAIRFMEQPSLSWRELYVSTPHLLFDGLYVSKSSYIRHGDANFQDSHFRPWFTVTYYRLLRFFADGTLLMTTSSESPQSAAQLLKDRYSQKSNNDVLLGTWWQENDEIFGTVSREMDMLPAKSKPRRGRNVNEPMNEYRIFKHSFSIRLQLIARRAHRWGLKWLENICTVTYFDGTQSSSDMEVDKDSQAFPPLRFHHVPSFGSGFDEKLT